MRVIQSTRQNKSLLAKCNMQNNPFPRLLFYLTFTLPGILPMGFKISFTRESWPRHQHKKGYNMKEQTTDLKQKANLHQTIYAKSSVRGHVHLESP